MVKKKDLEISCGGYEYENVTGKSQYSDLNLASERLVPARYIPAVNEADRGNPYIEALPPKRNSAEMEDYRIIMDYPGYARASKLSREEKYDRLAELFKLRHPLPYQNTLETMLHTVMMKSLKKRYLYKFKNGKKMLCRVNDEDIYTDGILVGDDKDSADGGFCLLGYSGSGKSSSMKILLDHIPMSIVHEIDGQRFVQIPYLLVNCLTNSNFHELYNQIGKAIDRALGNFAEPYYEKELRNMKNSLGTKSGKIVSLIERFGISVICLDEGQFMDYGQRTENCFDSLLNIANMTKVSLVVIATEDAYDKMFCNARVTRRLGAPFIAHDYCSDMNMFNCIVDWLFKYQYFEYPERVEIDDKIKAVLFKLTNGIVAHLVNLYVMLHYEHYLNPSVKFSVGFIRMVSKKYFSQVQSLLKSQAKLDANEVIHKASLEVEEKLKASRLVEKQKEEAAKIISESKAKESIANVMNNVYAFVNEVGEYSFENVRRVFNDIVGDSKTVDEKAVKRKVLEALQKHDRNRPEGSNVPLSKDDALAYIMGEKGDKAS